MHTSKKRETKERETREKRETEQREITEIKEREREREKHVCVSVCLYVCMRVCTYEKSLRLTLYIKYKTPKATQQIAKYRQNLVDRYKGPDVANTYIDV